MIRFFGLLFVFLILFSVFSLEADSCFSGEIYGKVYGFPVFWHGDGSSSLARVVYISGMFVCMLFYIILSFSVLSVLEVLVRVFKVSRRVGMIFFAAGGFSSVMLAAAFLVNFIHPEFSMSSDVLGDYFSSGSLHFGVVFK